MSQTIVKFMFSEGHKTRTTFASRIIKASKSQKQFFLKLQQKSFKKKCFWDLLTFSNCKKAKEFLSNFWGLHRKAELYEKPLLAKGG